ncbi:MAG: PAS domain S-box protein [Desulfobacterales bacterium]
MKVRDLLHKIKSWKFEVKWEPSAYTAMKEANEGNFDIALLDYHLVKQNGSDFFAELQQSEECVTPIILLTSSHEHLDDFEAVSARTVGCLEKATLSVYDLERSIWYAVEIKRATEELRESEERFRSIFYGAAIGIALLDIDGQIIETNPGLNKLLGYSYEEFCNFFLKDLIDPHAVNKLTELYQELIGAKRNSFQIEERFKHKDGRWVWLRLTASLFRDAGIPAKFVACLLEDVSQRKQARDALQQTEQRLRDLSRKILETQENERKLVAQELHDSVGGSLAAIKFALEEKLDTMQDSASGESMSLKNIISYVDDTIKETRRISSHLRPSMLDDLGLLPTIRWFCREFEKVHPDVRIDQQLDIEEDMTSESLKIVIYRVLQEALNNVAKHSNADFARLSLARHGDQIELGVEDNGCGFEVEAVLSSDDPLMGYGLSGMCDRAEICGGACEITSSIGKGTTVRISLPCGGESIDEE